MLRLTRTSPFLLSRRLSATALRWTSSATSTGSRPSDDEKPFNTEVTQEEINIHIKEYDTFMKNGDSKEYVKQHYKGFKDLQDKGEKTAEEQDRPEDYM
jgi:hypothetical protein